jgi:ABC-2 type transport system ATP-binding protein
MIKLKGCQNANKTEANMEIIRLEHVTKSYVIYEKKPGLLGIIKSFFKTKKIVKNAVEDISFSVNEGEIIGYIGPNGAGKSTTIKMLTGILTPTKGNIIVDGIVPYKQRTANAQKIGVVFGQRSQLWWDLPLGESFTVLKEIYRVSDADFKERMEYFNQIFGLKEFIKQPVRQLSLGQRMKAELAASFLHNPKIVYLDEPTIGLDVVAKENIRKTIKEMNRKFNTTVILTTHDLNDIEELCNRILLIDQGKIIYDGDIEHLRETYGSKKIISFTLKDSGDIDVIDVEKAFKPLDNDIFIEKDQKQITVVFNKHKLAIKEITSFVLNQVEVSDIDISDDPLENIIKEIYEKGIV